MSFKSHIASLACVKFEDRPVVATASADCLYEGFLAGLDFPIPVNLVKWPTRQQWILTV